MGADWLVVPFRVYSYRSRIQPTWREAGPGGGGSACEGANSWRAPQSEREKTVGMYTLSCPAFDAVIWTAGGNLEMARRKRTLLPTNRALIGRFLVATAHASASRTSRRRSRTRSCWRRHGRIRSCSAPSRPMPPGARLTRWCVARGGGAARGAGWPGARAHWASPVRAAPDRRPADPRPRAVPVR